MSEFGMEAGNLKDTTEWNFPQFDISSDSDEVVQVIKNNCNEELEKKSKLLNDLISQQQLDSVALEGLKADFKNKINILNNVLSQIEEPLEFIDEEFVELIQLIIKKAVKNIIGKEVKADPKLINKMINNLKELIHVKNGMINVFLSEGDFKRFQQDEIDKLLFIKSDPSLADGDIVLKSNYGEIHAILNERLDRIIKVK